jgi:predicted transcriptional regulator
MSYHLNVLEKGEFIKSIQDGNYRRFYLFGTKSDLKIALTTIQLRILSIVNERPGISQVKISESIGKNRMLVNYHIKILIDAGVLALEKSGRESHCFTTETTALYLPG